MRLHQPWNVIFALLLATGQDVLKSRIMAAVSSLDKDTLRGVWDEFNYRLDVVQQAEDT